MVEASRPPEAASAGGAAALRLHIGGTEPREGWRIFNIAPGPHVDFVGDCSSLAQFSDASVERIYASHVYEHLGHRGALLAALKEAHRVLIPDGLLQVSVPDILAIAAMMAEPARTAREQYGLMCHIFGAQQDDHDVHKVGLTAKLLSAFLRQAGFERIRRVAGFGLFRDWSDARRFGRPISLNMEARK
jgi:predicted SAM-dependent methyltransferase